VPQRAVLALLREHVKQETRGESAERELTEVLQDTRDAEVVVRRAYGARLSERLHTRGSRERHARERFRYRASWFRGRRETARSPASRSTTRMP
jgi:hypothetical protein